ncbi:Ketosamine-3-kinase [Cutaneotrichosporon oleaginosum]|uniref:protein-ribulosamine 3-kinase n=1 Tax=Cutaneotrichosporon oleaginosum TaxID=879819 RepID=A0A0J0XDI0_9TREE|nr:Ketosamine-3-kinase [Cutaneotrichosporon oleaginosum]KLT39150.1 Ketosamine-3-kinase [Cutaneotrichosporon oleaginosum]TXT11333.1 hypothetical protein COLE_01743 [Cutaneotrichosporon oleaginosum]
MRGEAASLAAMHRTAPPGLIPRILGFVDDDVGALVTEYAEGSGGGQVALGRALADMHRPPQDAEGRPNRGEADTVGQEKLDTLATYTGAFGFGVPTHCGATEQDNTWTESWEEFFRDRRLGDLVRRIGDPRVDRAWRRLKDGAVPLLLHDISPAPVPVPLHGDLWPGNVAGTAIYDPAGYYGHGEADLGMTRMFGGFSQAFYDAYHAVHPRSTPHYEQRIRLYELYHHLNHALMFGGGYTGGALRIMDELADWAEAQQQR